MAHLMRRLWQCLAPLAMRVLQRWGPHRVEVGGRAYVVTDGVFNPRFYFTSEFMAGHIDVRPGDRVLDMGTGSGIQAITAARIARDVVAVDISAKAVRCAEENVRTNGLAHAVSVLQSDLFAALPPDARFDVILFTPPYLEGKLWTEFGRAIRDPGKALAARFFREAASHLTPKGYVQMVYSTLGEPERVLRLAREAGWDSEVMAEKKLPLETLLIYRFTVAGAQ